MRKLALLCLLPALAFAQGYQPQGAPLPNPTASILGGVRSATCSAHQWLDAIATTGIPVCAQPAFTDVSGSVAASQLPNPSASTLGGVESYVAVSHQWINAISTSGVPASTQPATTDLSDWASVSGQSGKFLTNNGSTISWGTVSSGSTITYNAYASRPGAGTSGALFICNNCPVGQWVDDGSTWHPMMSGGVVGTQPIAAASWTSLNGGSTTLTDRNGAVHFHEPTSSGAPAIHPYSSQNLDAGSTTAFAAIETQTNWIASGFPFPVAFFRESGTGKTYTFGMVSVNQGAVGSTAGLHYMPAMKWTSFTAKSSETDYPPFMPENNGPLFIRVRTDHTNVYGEVSSDNVNWYTVDTTSVAGAFTVGPDQEGIAMFSAANTDAMEGDLKSYASSN